MSWLHDLPISFLPSYQPVCFYTMTHFSKAEEYQQSPGRTTQRTSACQNYPGVLDDYILLCPACNHQNPYYLQVHHSQPPYIRGIITSCHLQHSCLSNNGGRTRKPTLKSHLHHRPPLQRPVPRAHHRAAHGPAESPRQRCRLRGSDVFSRPAGYFPGGGGCPQGGDQISTTVGRSHDRVWRPGGPCPYDAVRAGCQHLP